MKHIRTIAAVGCLSVGLLLAGCTQADLNTFTRAASEFELGMSGQGRRTVTCEPLNYGDPSAGFTCTQP